MRLPLALVALVSTLALAGLGGALSTCGSPCEIGAHSAAYVEPVVVIEAGTPVVWTSLDTPAHIHAETPAINAETPCFLVTSNDQEDAPPVRFDIQEADLTATTLEQDGTETTRTCENAIPAADGTGGFLLAYHCLLHSQMHAVLHVVPAVA